MAKIKVENKTPKKTPRDPLFADEKYTGGEPTWDTERAVKFTADEFDHQLRKSLAYYNYYYSTKDLKKFLVQWVREHSEKTKTFDKATIDRFAKTSDSLTPFTACAIVKAHTKGMPLREQHVKYLVATVKKVIDLAKDEVIVEEKTATAKPVVKAPTIQDRLNEKMSELIGEIEGFYDEVQTGTTKFKAYDFFIAKNIPQAQLGKFERIFEKRKAELAEAQTKKDEQLVEGYSHLKAADIKRITAFIDDFLGAVAQYRGVKKATKKAAVRKPPAKEKLVAKLKYLKNDATNKLVSINPVDIIGAQELWVYNIKTRKLGKYVAEDLGGALSVKGTAIIGYNEMKSVQKTLRKPDQQLKDFLKAGKIELRKFLDNINATDIKLNGRVNGDTVLLKVA